MSRSAGRLEKTPSVFFVCVSAPCQRSPSIHLNNTECRWTTLRSSTDNGFELAQMMKSNRYADILARTCQRPVIGTVETVSAVCRHLLLPLLFCRLVSLYVRVEKTRRAGEEQKSMGQSKCYRPRLRERNAQCNHLTRPRGEKSKWFLSLRLKSHEARRKKKTLQKRKKREIPANERGDHHLST